MDFGWDSEKEFSNLAWYRKYRPKTLNDYAGTAIREKVRAVMRPGNEAHLPHFWFIQGTHGCGKTTLARLLTKYFLCQNKGEDGEPCNECEACRMIDESLIEKGTDKDVEGVTEVNASETNGKDALLQKFEEAKTVSYAKYNILILDEIQKASEGAQQALLKPLEDIADDFIVIMATTEPMKVLSTIRSRAQIILNVGRHSADDITARLGQALKAEGYTYEKSALEAIALREHGVFRESFNRLENVVATMPQGLTRVTRAQVDDNYNVLPDEFFIGYLNSCKRCDLGKLVLTQQDILQNGSTPLDFIAALSAFVGEGLECTYGKMSAGKSMKEFMSSLTDVQALRLIQALGECRERLQKAGKYDEGLSLLEVSALIYTKVFAPTPLVSQVANGGGAGIVDPLQTKQAGEQALEAGQEEFRQRVVNAGRGTVTEDTADEEDVF